MARVSEEGIVMRRQWLIALLVAFPVTVWPAPLHWVATFTDPQPLIPTPLPDDPIVAENLRHGFHDQTVRMIVHTSIAGSALRLRLTNPFDSLPVQIGAVHVALRRSGSDIVPGSDRTVLFNGNGKVTVGPGMVIVSDPVGLALPPQIDVAVSLYLPGNSGPPSAHDGSHTSYIASGNLTASPDMSGAETAPVYYWLKSIEVMAPASAGLIVALGDSITEGYQSTVDTDRTWPSMLSKRLAGSRQTHQIAVGDMGISSNRLLHNGAGASALARFNHDVLGQAGTRWVVLLLGINDIGLSEMDRVTADELIGGYHQIIEQAHAHGLKVIGGTLPPYEGADYFRPAGEKMRQTVNAWIRNSRAFDAVVDFDAATRDPVHPTRLRAAYDSGDHLHPNDAGYAAMANAFDLSFFRR
jgi:lysophospholipase L1-like esterase